MNNADTIVTLAKRSDWQYSLSPIRFAMPVRLTDDLTGYWTAQAAADALVAAEDRFDAGRHDLPVQDRVHRLKYAAIVRGWQFECMAGTAVIHLARTQIVNIEPVNAAGKTMTDTLYDKLQQIVARAKDTMRAKTDTERRLLATLEPADNICPHGLASIVITTDDGVHILTGWPARLLPQIPVDILAAQAVEFIRSTAKDGRHAGREVSRFARPISR